ncbi:MULTISPECIES: type II toxin-antitoxin system RelE/ParE family toxin [Proteiniphilum]|jgi:toxin ParE1/3/4|uniref:type II toxin-antitoxin system RelE/ParE family toxin n=1 Tax=Proteiniphilum TaxID=294702 RepID=UPI001EEB3A58|nr:MULTISPECIES: type II toxin-antitoxin system RelE/ParE family toxin [Proteiniphilum]MDD4754234.1 type II toxin-antitoxin system RelE/ParE family toxin [Desulfitobacteriaceae bacterium]ULB33343.1 type II toxin-antitoxin system RelE/ParE family toxin [Proteiniphilum propionicum]
MKFEISEKAFEDIENIWLYTIESWSVEQADRYFNLLLDEIEYITEHPLSEKNADHIRKNYRYTKVKSHLVFYRYKKSEKKVEIIRILHHSMDVEERMNE